MAKKAQCIFDFIKSKFPILGTILSALGIVSAVVGKISEIYQWNNFFIIKIFTGHSLLIWNSSIFVLLVALFVWIIILNNRFVRGFSDKFNGSLIKWDGNFGRITDDGLLVTGSDAGGITRRGADWENYTVKFRAKIMNSCLGVIVRAKSLDDYYMFQIGPKTIVPHRRITYPDISTTLETVKNETQAPKINIDMKTGWHVFEGTDIPLSGELKNWFDCCIKVNGQSISIYINNTPVFQKDGFLKNSKGKIGFRCWDKEEGLIEKVSVKLDI